MQAEMIRFLDILFALFGLVLLFPVLLILFVIGLFDTGSPLFKQTRVGRYQKPFTLIKFRTMKKETASVGTHLACSRSITKFGHFLRKTKLDELPQLWNVLTGDMSLVGPRPCLFNQQELIAARDDLNVFSVRPGITGMAQINSIDMSTPQYLAEVDALMVNHLNLKMYLYCLLQTFLGKGRGDNVIK
jgi:lipopolysaccharide/colanic/teichoic acid biosynthesis glycosyltransferase